MALEIGHFKKAFGKRHWQNEYLERHLKGAVRNGQSEKWYFI